MRFDRAAAPSLRHGRGGRTITTYLAFRAITRAAAIVAWAALPGGCVVAPIPLGVRTAPGPAVPAAPAVPAGIQYLYGSGEAAALSRQTWRALTAFVDGQLAAHARTSVVLAKDATLAAPAFEPCGAKPVAAVLDVDETVLLNRGFEYDAARGRPYDDARWLAYERTGGPTAVATPGAVEALRQLRRMGVTVIFNSNRAAANAAATEAALTQAGLGPARHGQTLWLQGDDDTGSRKDGRRARIAERFCVLALGGDQLGDFSDRFNAALAPAARRAAAQTPAIERMWGAGWFVFPNPVYGSALKGGLEDVFPADSRWPAER